MTPETALAAFDLIAGTFDGTPWSVWRIRYLVEVLTIRPNDFWEEWYATADPTSHLADLVAGQKIIDELGPNATHADLRLFVELEEKRLQNIAANAAADSSG